MAHQSIIDKTSKIVFVNNIPTDASEEKLKELFRKVGPIASFKIIYDKDSGKSKGCGICEYRDQETALTAVRSLNSLEMGDRNLKVEHALNEKTRLEMISVMQNSANAEPPSTAEKAPETISKAVASLPPEQMFELLKQMKQCVQNNTAEAKNMLMQNPQLAYALLQALVVMRIVDPQIAHTALSSTSTSTVPSSNSSIDGGNSTYTNMSASSMINRVATPSANASNSSEAKSAAKSTNNSVPAPVTSVPISNSRTYTTTQPAPAAPPMIVPPPAPVVHDSDLRMKIVPASRTDPEKTKSFGSEMSRRDPRLAHQQPGESKETKQTPAPVPSIVPPPIVPAAPQASVPPAPSAPTITPQVRNVLPVANVTPAAPTTAAPVSATAAMAKPGGAATSDNEKAALIMQVLRLTDAQIAMLPPEQRQSILLLKEQIAKSTKR